MSSTNDNGKKLIGYLPKHAGIGCLAMIGGVIVAFFVTALFAMVSALLGKAIPSEDMGENIIGQLEIALLVASFAAGIFVGAVCRERRGLYAVLTTILFPSILPPTTLLLWYALSMLDGQLIHPFLIPIVFCPVSGLLGAKLSEWVLKDGKGKVGAEPIL